MPNPIITDPKKRILHKIKQLFDMAEGRKLSNPEEAALAASRAQELLLKHKLDLSDISDTDVRTERTIFEEDLTFPKGLREVGNWKRILAATVCRHHFCMLFTTPRGLRFIGAQEDLAIAAWMYGYLSGQLERMAGDGWTLRKLALTNEILKNKRAGVTWKNNFYIGAIHVLSDRFDAMRRQVEQEAVNRRREQQRREAMASMKNGTSMSALARQFESIEDSRNRALAPFTEAFNRVNQYVNERYRDNVEHPEGEIDFKEDADGFSHGLRAGSRISLNKPLAGSTGDKHKLAQ